MKAIFPHAIDIKSTSVAANPEAEWENDVTYSAGDRVKVTVAYPGGTFPYTFPFALGEVSTEIPNKVYLSLRDNNLNRAPSEWLEPEIEIATSATSLAVSAIEQTLTVDTGKSFSPGMIITIAKTATPRTVSMTAEVVSYDLDTGELVANVYSVTGSGTHTAWTVSSVDEIGFWQVIESTNQYAMFDEYINTQTEDLDEIEVKLNVTAIDAIALFGLAGERVELELWDDTETTELWSDSVSLVYGASVISSVSDWWEYFFGAYSVKTDVFKEIGVALSSGVLVVRIVGVTGTTVKCGTCVVGRKTVFGGTQYGLRIGLVDYSYKDEDQDTGLITVSQGYWAKRNEITFSVKNTYLDHVYRAMVSFRGIPTAWSANSDTTNYEGLVVYGIFRDFEVTVPGPTISYCTMNIEGFI